jgi:transcriptional regulator with GAF, ATPase, and Fis domain
VRVVAATNRELLTLVRKGTFREDLYHRLRGYRLVLPPLRERRDDCLAIAVDLLAGEFPGKRLSPEAATLLVTHQWPGNMRELQNVVRAGAIDAGQREEIRSDDLARHIELRDDAVPAPRSTTERRLSLRSSVSSREAARLESNDEARAVILLLLANRGRVTKGEICATGISYMKAKRSLKQLKAAGTIIEHARGRATFYVLAKQP